MTRARDVANLIGSGNYSSTTFTATAGQTAFTISHTQGFVQVFMNGLLLDETADYTSNGSAITLTSGAAVGDEIEVVAYNTFSVGDALNQAAADTRYVNTTGDTMTGNLQSTELVANNAGNNTNIRVQNTASGSGSSDGFLIQNATNNKVYLWNYENADVLFGTNGTERMKIDGSGRVTKPNQPFCSVAYTGGNISSAQAVDFNVVTENNGSHYSTTNGRFTAPVAGHYMVNVSVLTASAAQAGFSIMKNSTHVRKAEFTRTGDNYAQFGANMIVNLAANDYVQVQWKNGTIYGGGGSYTMMDVYLLG